jgi:hypothetical protein
MNLRHAASLTLVGWYLMMPPHVVRNGHALVGVETAAPLGEWQISDSFDTADDCRDEKWKEVQEALKWRNSKSCPEGTDERPFTEHLSTCFGMAGWVYAQCIPSDDPRLKEK